MHREEQGLAGLRAGDGHVSLVGDDVVANPAAPLSLFRPFLSFHTALAALPE